MAQSSKPALDTSTAESTDPETSLSHDHIEESIERKLAVLEESSYGSSEFTDEEMDYSTPDGVSRSNSMASSVTTHAMTVIGIPRHILASKWLVAAILVSSTCVLGYFTYTYTNGEQEQDFKSQFDNYAEEIVDQSLTNVINTCLLMASFSKTVTSLALFANGTWPMLSLPHFETRASDFLLISKAKQVGLAPLVSDENREDWEKYTVANQDWIQEGLDFQYMVASTASFELWNEDVDDATSLASEIKMESSTVLGQARPIQETIWRNAFQTNQPIVEKSKGPHLPIWQMYPSPRSSLVVNFNLLSTPELEELTQVAIRDRHAVLSGIVDNPVLLGTSTTLDVMVNPRSVVLQPVFDSFEDDASVVAFLVVTLTWDVVLQDVVHEGAQPLVCVLRNACGQVYSYEVVGHEVNFLGEGDYHSKIYDSMGVTSDFAVTTDASLLTSLCNFTMHIYPTKTMEDNSNTNMPVYITLAVISMFAFTTLIFLLYDLLVQRQQSTLAATAMKTTAILGSLFPQEVHERLFNSTMGPNDNAHSAPKYRMRKMVSDDDKNKPQGDKDDEKKKDAPIADLFPECTVMFCDISGFTAWSSVREPTQVFMLLETVYNAFDNIANRRGVFKVETIGDSYLAVTGLPTPREDHALVMVKFSCDCLNRMRELTQSLELELGPGTAELAMRFGLHSGPVTAGVLRGEKTRFQLFGDTVNTASRMESTGERDKIQVSQETADLLVAAGRDRWIKPRSEKIMAKGKGQLQTYWANPRVQGHLGQDSLSALNNTSHSVGRPKVAPSSMVSVRQLHGTIASASGLDEKKKRSVHWISEIMVKLLKQILARRAVSGWNINMIKKSSHEAMSHRLITNRGNLVVDEIQDIITLPKFDKSLARKQNDAAKAKLPDTALEQLHSYISEVALMYRDNPFHNIDHAAHVCMSTTKLLTRIVAPETLDPSKENGRTFEARRHDHTYGITSDPLTQFACVFAALIHDADHPGCPNVSLVKEKNELALKYANRSVAEQNSFDLCWDLLMEEKYKDLRACIYGTQEEGKRFRQLVVNSIIATDISDKNLSAQRKARWNKAFHENADQIQEKSISGKTEEELAQEAINRKATIVIEHLIQASDVAHTMQHWHIYMKWNEKLFQEMNKAFVDGKIEKDPAESWYQGELGFYDFYIIPLAKKLKECGVFGVSSAEYLNYATANRQEWEVRGKDVVAGYVKKYQSRPPPPARSASSRRRKSIARVLSRGEKEQGQG